MNQTWFNSKHSRHNRKTWMSRHNMAQTTPTHATRFLPFSVVKTANAEERGSTTVACNSWNVVVRMQRKRVGVREWDCIGMLREGFLPGTSKDSIVSSSMSSITSSKQRLLRGDKHRQQTRNTINSMQKIWCMHMTWQNECVWLMQLKLERFLSIWTKGSNSNSNYEFTRCTNMHETSTNG